MLAVLRAPFTADTWRRTAYALVSPVVAAVSVPLSLVGGPSGRLQRGAARRLLGLGDLAEPERTGPRALVHALAALPLSAVAVLVAGYGWALVFLNLAYPVRELIGMGAAGDDAWGGPSMAGAWAFHALLGGLPAALVLPWLVRGLTWVQERLVRGLLT